MKMLYIANVRLPTEKAYGIQIMKMCEASSLAGTEVTLVIPTRANPEFNGVNPFDYYGVKKSFALQRIKMLDPWWLIRLPQGIYIKVQGFLFIFKLYIRFFIHNKYSKYDVAYTRDEYLLPLLHKFFPRVAWEAHTLPSHPQRYIRAWRKCQHIVAITKGLKDALVKQGMDPDLIMVAPDGVDVARFQISDFRFQIRQELGLPQDKKIVLYSGHLYEWKGAHVLLEAAREFQISNFKFQSVLFVFVGGTVHDAERFKERALKLQLTNVLIVGHRLPTEIPRWLRTADVLVIPNSALSSRSAMYTSPMKLFEYMASGVPIVASDVAALREILNGHNAIFFNPDNPRDCAEKIQFILKNEQAGSQRAAQARTDVAQYTWQLRAQKILNQLKL